MIHISLDFYIGFILINAGNSFNGNKQKEKNLRKFRFLQTYHVSVIPYLANSYEAKKKHHVVGINKTAP